MLNEYDVIVIGGGPAGLSASIYCSRYGFKTLVLEGNEFGGNVRLAHVVENYLGFESIEGKELAELFTNHASEYSDLEIESVISIEKKENHFIVSTSEGHKYFSKAIILATGSKHKSGGIKGEEEFKGKGVSYCATCDGFFFKNKDVAVIGNGNGAASSVVYLQNICNKVYLISPNLRAEKSILNKFKENVDIICESPVEIIGSEKVEGVKLKSGKIIPVSGIFINKGLTPSLELAKELGLEIENNFVKVNRKMETNVPGVFACGDITGITLQIAKAVGEGSIAGYSVFKYLKKLN